MKSLNKRAYNILFHTHTVSGITISFILFIIFFAGAISLYKQEFYQWENPAARIPIADSINYERLLSRLSSLKKGVGGADEVRVVMPTDAQPVYTFYAPVEDSNATYYASFIYNPVSDEVIELYQGNGNTTGDTLYRLHFLDQIPFYMGRYIAGFVALFFAFAIITGVLIHWKNIASKFYAFSFKDARKHFWTNAHTVFGVIGLPFQLMYAITGAFYMLSVLILAPAVMVLFKGDQDKLVTKLFPTEAFHQHHHQEDADTTASMSIMEGIQQIRNKYVGYHVSHLEIINPGTNATSLAAELSDNNSFNKNGTVVLDLKTKEFKLEIPPGQKNYVQSILNGINRLHFGNFGGWLSKALFFLLSMFTCFVIISGVLMWKQARNNARYSDKQKRFHQRVTTGYLSICFSLYPATALLFISEQLVQTNVGEAHIVNSIFFVSWLAFAIGGCFLKNESQISQYALVGGGLLACILPLVNGWATGDWIWNSVTAHPYVFMTDAVWLFTGILSLVVGRGMIKRSNTSNVSNT